MRKKMKRRICQFIAFFSSPSKKLMPMRNWERFYGNTKNIMEKARLSVYDHMKTPKMIQWHEGLKFMIYPNNDIGRALFTSGTYEPNSLLVVRNLLRPGSVFFDIGANAGVFTLAASKWVGPTGSVIAFEPSSREYPLLVENVALNGLSNVRLEKLAISDKTGAHLLHLAIHKHNGQNTLCQEFAYEGVNSGTTETVSLITLDQYVAEKGFSRIDLIKLDIEGAEYQAFLGAKNTLATLRPALVFEIVKSALQKNRIDIRDLEEFLNKMDYKTFSIDERTAQLAPIPLSAMKDGNAVALPR